MYKNLSRKLKYYLKISRFYLPLPLYFLTPPLYDSMTNARHERVHIVNANYTTDDIRCTLFVESTHQALQFIAENDPRRYRRVQAEIQYIVNVPNVTYANYIRHGRVCNVNFGVFRIEPGSPSYEKQLSTYARVIVHEATHGAIYSRFIATGNSIQQRIEMLCHEEERRFIEAVRKRSPYWDLQEVHTVDWDWWKAKMRQRKSEERRMTLAYLKERIRQ